jgi:hypothetical protein
MFQSSILPPYSGSKYKTSSKPYSLYSLLGLHFDPEDVGSMFLGNADELPDSVQHDIPEDRTLRSYQCEHPRSHKLTLGYGSF